MNYRMLQFDRIDISEGIDITKKCINSWRYWYFLDKSFKHEPIFAICTAKGHEF